MIPQFTFDSDLLFFSLSRSDAPSSEALAMALQFSSSSFAPERKKKKIENKVKKRKEIKKWGGGGKEEMKRKGTCERRSQRGRGSSGFNVVRQK
jgi:hypothetical protein